MCRELEANKFVCSVCGKVVKVNTFEDIIKFEKKCADCRLVDVTGGLKEAKPIQSKPKKINPNNVGYKSLKREDKKKSKKKLASAKRKEEARIKWDLKWERECYGRRNLD